MADDIRVKFNADSSSYQKQMRELVAQNKALQSEMKKVESSFNEEMSAEEKAAAKKAVLSKQIAAQKEYIQGLTAKMKELTSSGKENVEAELKQQDAINKANAALNNMEKELQDADKAADGFGDQMNEADKHLQTFTDAAVMAARSNIAEFFEKAGEAAAKLAKASYDAAKELDEGYDVVAKKTGATGDQLGELQSVADEVFGSMPVEMADVGTAVGELNTRFKLTGDQLASTSKTFLKFSRITDTDVNTAVASTAKILKAYGEDIENADDLLGYLAKQSQDTGVETNALMSSLEQNGATLREMGVGLQESVKLLASFEENGVDASAAMTGFKKAVANGAKEGKSANKVIEDMMASIKGAATDTEALAIATELFGTRGAAVMADGIRSGRISLDDLTESMEQYGSVVEDTFEATLDPWDQAKVAMNNAKLAGKELAGEALAAIAPLIEKVTEGIKSATEWFRNLPEPVKKVTGVLGLLGAGAAVVGPKILSVVNTIKSLQASANILKSVKGAADGAGDALSGMSSGGSSVAKWATLGAAAIAALNTALVEASLSGNEWYQAAKEDAEAMRELQAASERLNDAIDDRHAKEEAEQQQIKDLASELETLNKKTNLTADEQDRYKQIVAQLTSLLPDFNGEIDESTGKLKDQSQASTDAIDALADNKRALKAADNLTQALNDQAEAIANLREAEQTGKKWSDFFGISMDDLKAKTEGANVSSSKFGTALSRLSGNTSYTFLNQLATAAIETGNAMRQGEEDVKTTTEEVNNYSDAAGDAATASEELGDAALEMGESVEDASGDVEDGFEAILKAAKADLSKSITYLDQWADRGGASLEDMASQMQQNAKDMASWKQNVLTITSDARYGMDRNYTAAVDMLIAQGGKGATAVAQFAEAMRTGNTNAVNAFLTGYNGISTQSTQIENRIGTLQANAKAKLDGLKPAAEQGVAGMAEGMKASKALVDQAARQIAETQELAKISTSTAKSWGADAVKALAKGMKSEDWRVRKQANIIAQDVKDRLGHSTPKLGPLHGDDEWGYHLVENFASGLEAASSLKKLQSAALQTAYAAMPTMQMPAGNTTNNSLTYGDIVVNVSGANVQNEQALAKMVSDQIFRRVQAQKAVWS